jgi:hypothetical protein
VLFHLPIVYWRGLRLRPRGQWLRRWRGVHRHCDVFPEGTVWRVWIGWLLITVMIDSWPPGDWPPLPRPLPPPPPTPPPPVGLH